MPVSAASSRSILHRLCAIAGTLSIVALCACTTTKPAAPPPPPVAVQPPAPHQLAANQPNFFALPNIPQGTTPVRVGVILPFSDSSPNVRALAGAMLKAAELALYDSGNHDILLMTADDTGSATDAAAAAQKLLDQGAEVIIGPLFSGSVAAVAPLARDHGVPVLAFSTDRTVAGNGVYLLSFQPQSEVKRVVGYAASQGHKNFAAMIPQTPYGDVVEQSFRDSVTAAGANVVDVERFNPAVGDVMDPAAAIAKSDCDAIFIAQGGSLLRNIAPALAYDGIDHTKVQYLGTGLWDDPTNTKEPLLSGAWFAAPQPSADADFVAKYQQTFTTNPPQLAALAYDAVSLVALLAPGTPYHRFTQAALTDPNGFAGVDGVFRFRPDGTIERGLAVLSVQPDGFSVVSPAPTTFQASGS
ncbi:MAG: penicillin-binding protein activator [Alphaproteobacteria bacterium]|nr:penicillin-binding protein activator [Alphaproteobacteria bacterium]MDE1986881.1 penicillin-binding protein activator [Alphaproteobacteria bacterium]MDE2161644.1 penicillin-binding protein activator [Alphaproteobacteria bacterium]